LLRSAFSSSFWKPRARFWFDSIHVLAKALAVAIRSKHTGKKSIIVFNASTRINGLSLNAAFSLLIAWALQLAGVPVVHFVCKAGMSRCVLGTSLEDFNQPLPCKRCTRQSRLNYFGAHPHWFSYERNPALHALIRDKSLEQLAQVEYEGIPLGQIVLPALRWRLRVHNLLDDETTRTLYREFILSAWNVASEFTALLDSIDPQAVLVFNGQFFPEATVRWLCIQRGIRVITHEVAMQPLTAFLTDGDATAYPIHIPDDFELSEEQNARLDAYLEKRFQGNFSMAGIQFWPEMKRLDAAFLEKLSNFKYLVPVFTNVIFDTSQPHANTLFGDMFAWLDLVLEKARSHPDTLFVIRAHPDESRPGKASRESVAGWVSESGANQLANVVFISPDEYVSSYEMIQRAKFVMVYNSTIGLEASILGAAVLSAGKARYTQYPIVFFPESQVVYRRMLDEFLDADKVNALPEHRQQARRFMYYQLFRTSLPFDAFLDATEQRGYVRLARFNLRSLAPQHSPAIRAVLDGILAGGDFLLED